MGFYYLPDLTTPIPFGTHFTSKNMPEQTDRYFSTAQINYCTCFTIILEARNAAHNYIRANFTYNTRFNRKNASSPPPLITVPMLIMWGTGDLFLTKQLAESSAKQAVDCKLVFVEGASHWVQQDRPEEVNQHIREFLTPQLSKL